MPRVERRVIGITLASDLADADDRLRLGRRMIEKNSIALLHLIAHEVARGEVSHAIPRRRALRRTEQIVKGKNVRLGLDEPVFARRRSGHWRDSSGVVDQLR